MWAAARPKPPVARPVVFYGKNTGACDCELVALAAVLAVPLVTADKAVLKAFPGRAQAMGAFAPK